MGIVSRCVIPSPPFSVSFPSPPSSVSSPHRRSAVIPSPFSVSSSITAVQCLSIPPSGVISSPPSVSSSRRSVCLFQSPPSSVSFPSAVSVYSVTAVQLVISLTAVSGHFQHRRPACHFQSTASQSSACHSAPPFSVSFHPPSSHPLGQKSCPVHSMVISVTAVQRVISVTAASVSSPHRRSARHLRQGRAARQLQHGRSAYYPRHHQLENRHEPIQLCFRCYVVRLRENSVF